MKTISINVFSFNELSPKEKQLAMSKYDMDTSHIYEDAEKTIQKFHYLMGTNTGRRGMFDVDMVRIDENILHLCGLRLRAWLYNNLGKTIYAPKYLAKGRYSKVFVTTSCTLTGVCYDDDILSPIYDFIDHYTPEKSAITLENLITTCILTLKESVDDESEYRLSEEYFHEECIANDWMFDKSGNMYQQKQ